MSAFGPRPSRAGRLLVKLCCGAVLLSGVSWMVAGWWLDPYDFSSPLRVWRHRALVTHGVAAAVLLWLAGSLFPLHQRGNWRARRHRRSGLTLSAAMLVLALTGLLLYYPPHEDWRHWQSLAHQGVGLALVVLLPVHLRPSRRDRGEGAGVTSATAGSSAGRPCR